MSDPAEAGVADDLTAERDDDSRLVKLLRSQLKAQGRELAELRAGGSPNGESEEKREPRGLRQAYERASARLKELEAAERGRALQATFDAAGVPEGLRDMLGEKVEDPSAVTVEGLQAWMAEGGIQRYDPVGAHRTGATQRIDDLRASSTPVGAQRLAFDDFKQLQVVSPSAAAEALARGEVDLPAYIAGPLQANREERERGGGLFGG